MSTTTDVDESVGIPVYPVMRSPRCPFALPPEYEQWNRDGGLKKVRMFSGRDAWLVSRYDDVKALLSDPRISADAMAYPQLNHSAEEFQAPAFPRMDDPEHSRLRLMLTKDFTVKRVEAMRPAMRELINHYLDELVAKGSPADLVEDFALPIPSLMISKFLGVPYEDHGFFQQHSKTINQADATPEEKTAAGGALFLYFIELLDRKEIEPGDDLVSRLLVEKVATGELEAAELAMNGIILLVAGHDTTANMTALGTLTLLEHPEQAARIRETDDPKVIANAVEELLRFLSIPQDMIWRVAKEDLVIGGQQVSAGDVLTVNLPAANRDPAFIENGDVLDIGRSTTGHIAFGHGVHQCIGQTLARVLLQEALPALLRRLPNLHLTVPLEEVKFRHDMSIFGVYELPVAW